MRKSELVRRLVEDGNSSPGEAADQLDAVVHETLLRLRSGKPAKWPGLGSFEPDPKVSVRFEPATQPQPARPKKRGKA